MMAKKDDDEESNDDDDDDANRRESRTQTTQHWHFDASLHISVVIMFRVTPNLKVQLIVKMNNTTCTPLQPHPLRPFLICMLKL